MPDLVIVAFPDEATAFEVRAELVKLQREYLIEMEDIVIITRGENGEVKLHQALNLAHAGAVGGGFWGALIGLLFMNPLVGAAVGVGTGALAGYMSDLGIDDEFLRDVGQSVEKGGSAVAVLIRKMTSDKVMERMKVFGAKGRVIRTSLSDEAEGRLKSLMEQTPPTALSAPQPDSGNT